MNNLTNTLQSVLNHTTHQGYSFTDSEGNISLPSRSQIYSAEFLKINRRCLNLGGMGSGKTLTAVYASRHIGAHLTVIFCPNNTVPGWTNTILRAFSDNKVVAKEWQHNFQDTDHGFMVFNFEMLQQDDSDDKITELLENNQIDFIVIDEVQFVKQRSESMSKRRLLASTFIELAGEVNPDLAVLGMSGTPVINDLREGITLIEMITGKFRPDLKSEMTQANCTSLYKEFNRLGHRWLPNNKDTKLNIHEPIAIDVSGYIEEIQQYGAKVRDAQIERVLTKARLSEIANLIIPKTVIYSHLVEGVVDTMVDYLTDQGWNVDSFTGGMSDTDKINTLQNFKAGDIDVLIVSAAVATGVDGLQYVSNRLIVNILPWTSAEFDQLVARLYRQGQKRDVDVFLFETHAEFDDMSWSYCKSKLDRITNKRILADACVDGKPLSITAALGSDQQFEQAQLKHLQNCLATLSLVKLNAA